MAKKTKVAVGTTTSKTKSRRTAASPARSVWKGAVSFGLVNIPIVLFAATRSSGIDFDWLDRRTLDPVGYKRVNKKTGQEIAAKDITRGVEYERGHYVVLSAEEIEAAYPRTTQTIDIEAFVDADEVPFVYLERPYYLAPLKGAEKTYALLREALRRANRVAVARVVIHTKQHLAVLIPCGRALVLNLLRWGGEVRSSEELNLPPAGEKAAGLRDSELKMAQQLIEDMSQAWDADQFRNTFADEIRHMVEAKAHAGEIESVQEESPQPAPSNVVDLTSLLKRSLRGGRASDDESKVPSAGARGRAPAKKTSGRKSEAKAAPRMAARPTKKATSARKSRSAEDPARKAA